MPTLLWGCVMDYLMTMTPEHTDGGDHGYLLKLSPNLVDIGHDPAQMLSDLRRTAARTRGPFVNSVRQASAECSWCVVRASCAHCACCVCALCVLRVCFVCAQCPLCVCMCVCVCVCVCGVCVCSVHACVPLVPVIWSFVGSFVLFFSRSGLPASCGRCLHRA